MRNIITGTNKDKYHFLIFERETEEESVLTIASLLNSAGYKVSVFVSEGIASLIQNNLQQFQINPIILPPNLIDALTLVDEFKKKNNVDLIIFPRFSANSFRDFFLYKNFVKKYRVCSLIENYDRWFRILPPLKLRRSKVFDWVYCRLILNSFSCYFVSDPHVNSKNPLKLKLIKKTNKHVFDFPFKVMEQDYNPSVNNKIIHFVIPGSVDKNRRDYFLILDILTSKELINKEWKLILLGRPIGDYGKKVINYCSQVNKKLEEEKIVLFDHYISKEKFNQYMLLSDYIIAPILPNKYKLGKDSGALYDVFLYNKIGIFNDGYFYDKKLPERDVILKYKDKTELNNLLTAVIFRKPSFNLKSENIDNINSLFSKKNYINNLKYNINKLFKNE